MRRTSAEVVQMPPRAPAPDHRVPVVGEPRVRRCGHYTDLTPQEREVMALVAADLSGVEIAARTDVSEHAVRRCLAALRQKLGAATTPQMIDIGCRTGLLVPRRATLKREITDTVLTSFQALADGNSRTQIARSRNFSKHAVARHLAIVRSRMRVSWNPAAVYRLHGVTPPVLDATAVPCPLCAARGAS
ncbi:LuxR C-terminal-related transcriptional regulator [Kitasatospora sp. NPDC001119]